MVLHPTFLIVERQSLTRVRFRFFPIGWFVLKLRGGESGLETFSFSLYETGLGFYSRYICVKVTKLLNSECYADEHLKIIFNVWFSY